jgi:hypothetical protein
LKKVKSCNLVKLVRTDILWINPKELFSIKVIKSVKSVKSFLTWKVWANLEVLEKIDKLPSGSQQAATVMAMLTCRITHVQ